MRDANLNEGIFARFAHTMVALLRRPDFSCADCERSLRCGLPPSDRCIARAAQIARDDWKVRRRDKAPSKWWTWTTS